MPRAAHGLDLAAAAAATEETAAAVGFQSRHTGWHLHLLQRVACLGIDAQQIALLAFPGGMPELAVDPGDARDDAFGFDGADHLARFRIDLMDLVRPIFADPERTLGPGHA